VREAVATPGGAATTGFQRLLQKCATQKVWVAFQSKAVFEALVAEGISAAAVTLPTWPWGKDALTQVLEGLLEKPKVSAVVTEPKDNAALWNGRKWEVKGVEKGGVRLKATVKVGSSVEGGPFFLETVDLYSARSREAFTRKAAEFLIEDEAKVAADVGRLVEWCERWEAGKAEKQAAPEMTQAEREEALAFLHDPKLMTLILEDFEACGLSGEENNKLTGYVAAVSRKLEEPVSVLIQSRSAAGKSSLQDAILRFVPPEELEKYTRLTGQALFYKAENGLCHKVVAIEEEAGAREASYSIRNLQSSKYLSIATTEKDSTTGKMKTVEYRVKGPVALMLTTTAVDMDFETANRFLTLTIDESREMTERILAHQRRLETVEGLKGKREMEAVVRRHQNAQRLLRPLAVVNPYAPTLTFPAGALRARRDQKKYLGLIRAIAFLHQYQREAKVYRDPSGLSTQAEAVEYIEATKADVEAAHRLLGGVLGRMGEDLSAPGRALFGEIRKLAGKAKEAVFTRRAIREACGWSDFQVKTHLGELVELEYLWAVTGRKGKEYVYELAAATPSKAPEAPRLKVLETAQTT